MPSPGPQTRRFPRRQRTSLWGMASSPRRASLAIALLFALTSVFTLAVPAPTLAWSDSSFSASSEADLIALTNRSRANAGMKALRVDSTLTSVARWRSKDMIERDYFSHTIPGYGKVWDKLDAIGYCYHVAGENIGWNNYPDDVATAAIQQMFMDSAGHRANILGSAWDVIGDRRLQGLDRQEDVDRPLRGQVRDDHDRDAETDRQAHGQADRPADCPTNRATDGSTDRPTDRRAATDDRIRRDPRRHARGDAGARRRSELADLQRPDRSERRSRGQSDGRA